jgi:hypothetical protein
MVTYKYSTKLIVLMWVFLLIGIGETISAAEISAVAKVDRNVVTVGDLVTLTIEVQYESDLAPRMPGADTPLGEFEVRNYWTEAPQTGPDGKIMAKALFSLSVFSPGVLEIPSVEVTYVSADGSRQGKTTTEPVEVKVARTLTDESEDIEDIKPPLEIPRDWFPIFIAFLGGAILAGTGLYVYRMRSRRVALEASRSAIPDRPPHEVALEALERVKRSDLLVRGEIPRFHIMLAEIIRHYIEGRYRVDALEMASDEVLDGLRRRGVEDTSIALFKRFLEQCDLVKFAKLRPSDARCLEVLNLGFEIIEQTRPVSVASSAAEEDVSNESAPSKSESVPQVSDQAER